MRKPKQASPGAQPSSDEVSVLECAASGLCETFAAHRVLCGLLDGEDGLWFVAAAPPSSGIEEPLRPPFSHSLKTALVNGAVVHEEEGSGKTTDAGSAIIVPIVARGEVLGAYIMHLPEGADSPSSAVLALLGSQVGAAIAAVRDCEAVTERLNSMRDMTSLLDDIVESSRDVVVGLDLAGRVTRWNRAAEELLGYSRLEVVGEVLPHVSESSRKSVVTVVRRLAAGNAPIPHRIEAVRKDGRHLAIEATAIPVGETDGTISGVVIVGGPHTLEDPSKDEDDFVSVISAELKAPLTALAGYAQLLARPAILSDTSRRTRVAQALQERGAWLGSLVDDLLRVADLERRVVPLDLEPIDVKALLADAVSRCEQISARRRFEVDIDASAGTIHADRPLLMRAMIVFLDAMAKLAGSSRVPVRARAQGGAALIEVRLDPPHGSTDASLTHDPTVESGVGAPHDGGESSSGLGMCLARMIVEAHGGEFRHLHSDEGDIHEIVLERHPRVQVTGKEAQE